MLSQELLNKVGPHRLQGSVPSYEDLYEEFFENKDVKVINEVEGYYQVIVSIDDATKNLLNLLTPVKKSIRQAKLEKVNFQILYQPTGVCKTLYHKDHISKGQIVTLVSFGEDKELHLTEDPGSDDYVSLTLKNKTYCYLLDQHLYYHKTIANNNVSGRIAVVIIPGNDCM